MHTGADRHPRPARLLVARGAKQLLGSGDRSRGVPLTGEQREEEGNQLVADELVDVSVVLEDDAGGRREVSVQELAVLAG